MQNLWTLILGRSCKGLFQTSICYFKKGLKFISHIVGKDIYFRGQISMFVLVPLDKSRFFLKSLPFHVQNSDLYISSSLNYYCYSCQYILSPNIWVLCLFSSPSSRHSLYIDFVSPYIILPYARTKELVCMLKTLHGTRLKQLLRTKKCPNRTKHVTNAVNVIELLTQNFTNACLLETCKMTQFIDVEYIYGFVWWGGLQAKSMTSQRNRAVRR